MCSKLIALKNQRGLTVVEVLAGAVVLALLAAGAAAGYRALSRSTPAVAAAAEGNAAVLALQRVMEEAGNGVLFTEATSTAFTVVASTSSSAVAWGYQDPATGGRGVLRRYAVRYYYQNGVLYRAVGAPPQWARLPEPVGPVPVAPPPGQPPTPPSVPHPGQPPQDPGPAQYTTVFQGYWLQASGRSGIAVRSAWTEQQRTCLSTNEETGACNSWGVRTVGRASGPEKITRSQWDQAASSPLRDQNGNVIGYRIGNDVFANPQAFQNILNRPEMSCWMGEYGQNCTPTGYYYVTGPQPFSQQEYQATINSPMTVQTVDPAWQQAYDQYQRDLATWQDRYNQWVNYYNQYGMWSREAVYTAEMSQVFRTIASAGARQPANYAANDTSPTVDLSTARAIARYDALTFRYLDANRQPTTDPARVRTVIAVARTGGGNASASATIGIPGASASGSRQVRIPTPCDVNPSLCASPPPPRDPTEYQFEQATGRDIPRDRTYAVDYNGVRGTVTYRADGTVSWTVGDDAAYQRALTNAQNGVPGSGHAQYNSRGPFSDTRSRGFFNDPTYGRIEGSIRDAQTGDPVTRGGFSDNNCLCPW